MKIIVESLAAYGIPPEISAIVSAYAWDSYVDDRFLQQHRELVLPHLLAAVRNRLLRPGAISSVAFRDLLETERRVMTIACIVSMGDRAANRWSLRFLPRNQTLEQVVGNKTSLIQTWNQDMHTLNKTKGWN